MVLGKLPVPGRPSVWMIVGQGLTALAVGAGGGCLNVFALLCRGWSGGAMVLGKRPVPGRPTSLDKSRARANCSCSRCGLGLFEHFYSHLSFLSSFSLSLAFSLSLGEDPI